MTTSPPWSLIRCTVSSGLRPPGTCSCRKRPMISPSVLPTSSPMITVKGAIFCTASAPAMLLCSVTATQLIPRLRQAGPPQLRLVQHLLTALGQPHPLLVESQRLFEGKTALLELGHRLLEPAERLFERFGGLGHATV